MLLLGTSESASSQFPKNHPAKFVVDIGQFIVSNIHDTLGLSLRLLIIPRLTTETTLLYIHVEELEPIIVGNVLANVISVVSTKNGQKTLEGGLFFEQEHKCFLPLKDISLTRLSVSIYDQAGQLCQFEENNTRPTIAAFELQNMALSKNFSINANYSMSSQLFPTNVLSEFKVQLPGRTELNINWDWEVALAKIIFPKNILATVQRTVMLCLHDVDNITDNEWNCESNSNTHGHYYYELHKYRTISALIHDIAEDINRSKFKNTCLAQVKDDTLKIMHHPLTKITFDRALWDILGLEATNEPDELIQRNELSSIADLTFEAMRPVDIFGVTMNEPRSYISRKKTLEHIWLNNIVLECDVVKPSFTGTRMRQVMEIVPVSNITNESLCHVPKQLVFHPVSRFIFSDLSFRFATVSGENHALVYLEDENMSEFFITLTFRKI